MADIHAFCPLWGSWMPEEKLGEGSFGTVWKMRREELGKTYYSAVKHLSVPKDPSEIQRLIDEGIFTGDESAHRYYDGVRDQLIDEINTMYKLRGFTNIVSYEDHLLIPKESGAGYDIFLRMELLQGLPAKAKQGMTTEDVVKLGEDIATAIDVLNRHGLVHRDIKPQNIFLNDIGDYKLGDYGTARALESNATAMSRKGTYNYMAPEIYNNEQADWSVDVYSLGIVLYRYMNGNRLPFLPLTGDITNQMNEEALLKRIKGLEPIPAPAYADPTLSAIILKACAFDPKDRYPNGKAMKEALAAYTPGNNVISSVDQEGTVEDSHQFAFGVTAETESNKSTRSRRTGQQGNVKAARTKQSQISVSIETGKGKNQEDEKTTAEVLPPAQSKSAQKNEQAHISEQGFIPSRAANGDSGEEKPKPNKTLLAAIIGAILIIGLVLVLVFAIPKPSYTVIWKNEDGSILDTDVNVSGGTIPEYDGVIPSKADTKDYSYEFSGWTPALTAITENMTYTAVYNSIEKTPEETEPSAPAVMTTEPPIKTPTPTPTTPPTPTPTPTTPPTPTPTTPPTPTPVSKENGWLCQICGNMNLADSIFCEECGHQNGEWTCEECGYINNSDAVFCEECGHSHGGWTCGNCGFVNVEDAEFCEECGLSRGKWKCESCGFINEAESSFCEECGTKKP